MALLRHLSDRSAVTSAPSSTSIPSSSRAQYAAFPYGGAPHLRGLATHAFAWRLLFGMWFAAPSRASQTVYLARQVLQISGFTDGTNHLPFILCVWPLCGMILTFSKGKTMTSKTSYRLHFRLFWWVACAARRSGRSGAAGRVVLSLQDRPSVA